jgi:hypothetical protein
MSPLKRGRTIRNVFQVWKVWRKKPCIVNTRVFVTIAADKDLAAWLAIQEFEYAGITVFTVWPRLHIETPDRRHICTVRRSAGSSRALGVDADPQTSSIVEEVMYPEGEWCNFYSSSLLARKGQSSNDSTGGRLCIWICPEERFSKSRTGKRLLLSLEAYPLEYAETGEDLCKPALGAWAMQCHPCIHRETHDGCIQV